MKKTIIALLMVMTSMLFITGVKADFKTGDEISFTSHKNTTGTSYGPIKFEVAGGYVGTCSENQESASPSGKAKIKEKVALTSDAAKAIYYFAIVKDWQRGLGKHLDSSEGKLGWSLENLGWYYGGNNLHEAFVREAENILNSDQGWKTVKVPSGFEIYFVAPNDDSQEFVLWRLAPFEASKKYASNSPKGKNNAAVKVGDEIKYEIEFKNGDGTLTITDTLSKGLEYVANSAKIGNTAVNPTVTKNNDGTTKLVWTTTETTNKLTYNTKVTKDAANWVNNDASIKVGNNDDYKLTKLTNPVPKKEYKEKPNDGYDHATVDVGKNIYYKITLPNVKKEAQTIVVTDILSKGLTYNQDIKVTNGTIKTTSAPSINSSTKATTLVWTIEVPANKTATLVYSAKVNNDAVNLVNNNASCKYGNEGTIKLNELHNPVPKKEYTSDTPHGLNGQIVQKGDIIRYKISYANPYETNEKITIRDILSKGLTFKKESAKVCNEIKEGRPCEKLDSSHEVVIPKEDGTTEVVWTRDNVVSLGIETIEYEVEVTGETVNVQNDAKIKYGNRPETDINQLKNPVPSKEYDKQTPSGLDGAAVSKRDRIRYSIKYVNIEENEVTVTIKDTISKGIEYIKGTSKINGQKIDDPKISDNNKTLTWERKLVKDQEEVLTYEVIVTGETITVNNKASMIYSNNPDVERFLNKLENPVPRKDYADDTKAGANGEYVKKDDVITYSIKYSNVKKNASTVIITDNISKGLEYEKGSAKINGESIEPSSITKDANGTMLIWVKEIKPGENEELKYSAKVTGEKMLVENNANIQYDSDPAIKLDELRNPLKPEPEVVKVPNTLANIPFYIIISGLGLLIISLITMAYINKKNSK